MEPPPCQIGAELIFSGHPGGDMGEGTVWDRGSWLPAERRASDWGRGIPSGENPKSLEMGFPLSAENKKQFTWTKQKYAPKAHKSRFPGRPAEDGRRDGSSSCGHVQKAGPPSCREIKPRAPGRVS